MCGLEILASMGSSIAGRFDPGPFDHEDHGSLRSSRPMHHALWDGKALSRAELDCPAIQINLEAPFDHVEEFVLLVVLVPVKLALQDAEPHDAVIDPAERLIVPGLLACIDERLNVDQFERTEPCVQVDRIR
jgi:hypothetical protein